MCGVYTLIYMNGMRVIFYKLIINIIFANTVPFWSMNKLHRQASDLTDIIW